MKAALVLGGIVVVVVVLVSLIIYFGVQASESTTPAKSAPPPPPVVKPVYVKISGVDYPGNDIKNFTDLTPEQCKAECDKEPTCALATMSTDGKNCWIKTAAKSMYVNSERDNYFKHGRAYDPIGNYEVVKPGAHCGGTHTFSSPSWALLESGEPKTFADFTVTGDTLYNTYINRGLKKCDEDTTCKYVSVWRDAGYRTYKDGQCDTHNSLDNPTIFRQKQA